MPTEASYPIPAPISVNGMFANVAGKGRVRSQRYKTWAASAGWIVKSNGPIRKVSGPVRITLAVPRPRTNMDLDNCAKAYIDLLVNLGAMDDDKCVIALSMWWQTGKQGIATIESVPS